VIGPELAKLAKRKRDAARVRVTATIAEAKTLLQTCEDWHTKEYAPVQSRQAITDIEAADKLYERGGFLDYINADRLAHSGVEAAKHAIAVQKNAFQDRLKNDLKTLTQGLDQASPFARLYATNKLDQLNHDFKVIDYQPSSYDAFIKAFAQVDQCYKLLCVVIAESKKNYEKKLKLGAGIGGAFGALLFGTLGLFIGFLVGAVIFIVLLIPLLIIGAVSGHANLSTSAGDWIVWSCTVIGAILGAVDGAVDGGNTVKSWFKKK